MSVGVYFPPLSTAAYLLQCFPLSSEGGVMSCSLFLVLMSQVPREDLIHFGSRSKWCVPNSCMGRCK